MCKGKRRREEGGFLGAEKILAELKGNVPSLRVGLIVDGPPARGTSKNDRLQCILFYSVTLLNLLHSNCDHTFSFRICDKWHNESDFEKTNCHGLRGHRIQ
jgi:hypothetical protein